MKQPKITKRDVLSLAAGAAAAAFARPALAQTPSVVKIGMVEPLSGLWAATGTIVKAGADLAIEDVNRAGGIKSIGGAKLELVPADAEDSVEKAKNAAQRLLAQENDLIGGVGVVLSGMTLAVTELTERAELPWFTMSFADAITERGFRYVFESVPVATVQARETLGTILDLGKAAGKAPTSVAVIADTNQAIQTMAKTWRDGAFAQHNLKLVSERPYSPPLSDPTQLIEELRRNRPDFLFPLPSNLPDLKLLLDKMTEFGLGRGRLPTFTIGGQTGNPDLLKVSSQDIVENLSGVFANWPGAKHKDLVERFKARTGQPWMHADALNSYGQIMIFRDALEKAGVPDRRKVAEEIRAMNSTTGAAEFFTGRLQWDEKGRRTDPRVVVVQWQGGLPKPIYPPELATTKAVWGGR